MNHVNQHLDGRRLRDCTILVRVKNLRTAALKCISQEFFFALFETALKMMKNDIYFIVIALLVPESRDGAVVRELASHQCGLGSISRLGVICGLSLFLVLFSAPRGFSPGTLAFLSPLNSISIWNARTFDT